MLILGVLVLLQLRGYAEETSLSFQIEEKTKGLNSAQNSTERLRMEIHRENSLESLERRAQELGFTKATPQQYASVLR
ncbi:MAG: hypothetical protein FWE76_00200 [Symbiobacteriaceae bacterium]|nr:hypothetical protein [Symbiobacteriaceae bacterium]